jgi:Glyoxalase-like domain
VDPIEWQLTIDAADPHAQADFWAAALGYRVEDNSEMIERLITAGVADESLTTMHNGVRAWRRAEAIRGGGRRLLFQTVPEPKTLKNRVHLDLNVGTENLGTEVTRLEQLGATRQREVIEPGTHHIVLTDPEGNEFCIQ